MTNEPAEIQKANKAPLLVSMEKRQGAIQEACASGSVAFIDIMSSLQKAILKDNRIAGCDPASVCDAMMACAKLGIDPSGEHNNGWFICYKNELKLMIGYGGYIDLITRSGQYNQIDTEVVYAGEAFEAHRGSRNEIIHEISNEIRNKQTQGNYQVASAYAIARGPSGLLQFMTINKHDIEAARNASKAGGEGPWKYRYTEMVKKTAVRALAKWMVLDRLGQEATAISDEGDGFSYRKGVQNAAGGHEALENMMRDDLGQSVPEQLEALTVDPKPSQDTFDVEGISAAMDVMKGKK